MVGKTRPVTEHMQAAAEAATTEAVAIINPTDPHHMRPRLEAQTSRLLNFLEDTPDEGIEVKPFLYSLIQLWRIETLKVALRKEKLDEPNRGSAVRKYAAAFKANGSSRRKTTSGPEPEPEPELPESDLESILDDEWGADDATA